VSAHQHGDRQHKTDDRKAATAVISDRRTLLQHAPEMTYEQMLEKVRYEGAYPTESEPAKPSAWSSPHSDTS
jgi:hypothetical protein